MTKDKYGQIIYNEIDVCRMYLEDPERSFKYALIDHEIKFDADLELNKKPNLVVYDNDESKSIEEFDAELQSKWHMPSEYAEFDIVVWLLDQCNTDEQRQRVGQELLLYVDRNLIPLLQYMRYLVDTMRANNIVWGVGRGSSVASYVLFLIGVHRIDSMYFGLEIEEFLK